MVPKYITQEEVFQILTELNDPFQAKVRTTEVMRRINAIHAADVVEVVRCRECKHLCVHSKALGVYQCAVHGDYPSGEYFCADGERKDGGQDDV